MTIPAFTQNQMLRVLNCNGYDVISDRYWDTDGLERVVMGKGPHNFVLKLKKFYFFPEVIKRCQMLDIKYDDIPEDLREEFSTCFKDWERMEELKKGVVGHADESNPDEDSEEDDKKKDDPEL